MENRNLWNRYDADQLHKMEEVTNWYKICLDKGKTERECVNVIVNMVEKSGYVELEEKLKKGGKLKKSRKEATDTGGSVSFRPYDSLLQAVRPSLIPMMIIPAITAKMQRYWAAFSFSFSSSLPSITETTQ